MSEVEHEPHTPAHEELSADVAIVGAGPAGIVLALELAKANHRVILLESGADSYDPDIQQLGDTVGNDEYHVDMRLATRRQVGGASNLWGGRCVPFDPIDFVSRSVADETSWPVSYSEFASYLQRACEWCRCGDATFNTNNTSGLTDHAIVPGFGDDEVSASSLKRWSLPTNFGRIYRSALEHTSTLHLITSLTCTEVVPAPMCEQDNRWSVDHLVARGKNNRRATIRAKRYVIAAGGLESTRLLFASTREHPDGIGNHSGHLGRWYMAHVEARVGKVCFDTNPQDTIYSHERDQDGIFVRRRFTLSERAQLDQQLPNMAMWLVNPEIGDASHRSSVLSFVYLMLISPFGKHFVAEGIRQAHIATRRPTTVRAHLTNVVRDLGPATKFALTFGYQRFVRRGRKVPGFFVRSPTNTYPILYHGEHLPHYESFVAPTGQLDTYGMPRLQTHLHFSDEDVEAVRRAHELLDRSLRAQKLGHIEFLLRRCRGRCAQTTVWRLPSGRHDAHVNAPREWRRRPQSSRTWL